ncbi:MAG: EscU/YscU/HrcU family type III secretion system export apparatus switch protein [Mariprofundaceae bacterium]|nr:EscU/YscU/HrcU family type III secretion system export apparatus switch protein [Mariprofundaceae bacterium]
MSKTSNRHTQAIALQWTPLQEAVPKVKASGTGALADEILRIAKENNIPIREDKDLVQILSLLDIGESIPSQTHTAIAEILAFIYWSNQQYEEIINLGDK